MTTWVFLKKPQPKWSYRESSQHNKFQFWWLFEESSFVMTCESLLQQHRNHTVVTNLLAKDLPEAPQRHDPSSARFYCSNWASWLPDPHASLIWRPCIAVISDYQGEFWILTEFCPSYWSSSDLCLPSVIPSRNG